MGLLRSYTINGERGYFVSVTRVYRGYLYELWADRGGRRVLSYYVEDGPLITQLKREGVRV